MNNEVKRISEFTANRMIADFRAGKSIFERPASEKVLAAGLPFNLETGNKYKGPAALVLLMQNRDDPRWGTMKQANYNRTSVWPGSTGTTINFYTKTEHRPILEDGKPVLKENGEPKTEKIKHKEPILADALLFNGKQLKNLPEWKQEPQHKTPVERAQNIIANSKAVIIPAELLTVYSPDQDMIFIADKEEFEAPEKYYATVIREMAHWSGHESRLDRPIEGEAGTDINLKEELRANIAALLITRDLNLPYELGDHVGYIQSWSQLLKEDPSVLFNAADDAQKIADYIMGFEKKMEVKQEAESKQEIDQPRINPAKLTKGEIIPYNGTEYKVLTDLKKNQQTVQDLTTKDKFKVSPDNGLYDSLINARDNSQEQVMNRENEMEELDLDTPEDAITFNMAL